MAIKTGMDLKHSAKVTLFVIAILWLIKVSEVVLGLNLAIYGVYPRDLENLAAVLCAPLIHGSFDHLAANTLPLFVLGTAMLYHYPKASKFAFPLIYIGSGLGVWLFARSAFHIGASGITHGMMFFLFIAGILRRDTPSIALALIVFFLYGGMLVTIFPTQAHISFESHLFGAIAGALSAYLFHKLDAKRPEKKYSWELDEEDAEDRQTDRDRPVE